MKILLAKDFKSKQIQTLKRDASKYSRKNQKIESVKFLTRQDGPHGDIAVSHRPLSQREIRGLEEPRKSSNPEDLETMTVDDEDVNENQFLA